MDPDTLYPGKGGIEMLLNTGSEYGTKWIPAEVDVSIRPGWFYHAGEDSLVKSPEKLFEIYLNSVGRGSNLLLNIPPDSRGLLHENDTRSLLEWKKLRDEAFATNLAAGAKVTASSYRGNTFQYNAENLVDDNNDTYWATDDETTTADIVIDLGTEKCINYILLQEYIRLGQRIRSFQVEILKDDQWQAVAYGTTVGYKRILKLENVCT